MKSLQEKALNLTIDRLRKVLELEQAKGYRDQAVVGGLDRLLHNMTAADPGLAQMFTQSYSTLNERQREEWVSGVLEQMDNRAQEEQTPNIEPVTTPPRPNADIDRYLAASITSIKGISSSLAAKFGKLGVQTVRDLLYFFPHRYIDYSRRRLISELEVGREQTVVATVWEAAEATIGRRRRATEAIIGDESGNMRVVWFNQPYLAKKLTPNSRLVISLVPSASTNFFQVPASASCKCWGCKSVCRSGAVWLSLTALLTCTEWAARIAFFCEGVTSGRPSDSATLNNRPGS